MLRRVYLYGALTKYSKEPIEAEVDDMAEVVRAMKSWFPGFTSFLQDYPDFCIVVTKTDKKEPQVVHPDFFTAQFAKDDEEIHLFPAPTEGAEVGSAFYLAVTAIVGTGIAYTITVNLLISLAIGVVMNMLAPKPSTGQSEKPQEQPSFLFNGPENVQEQGYMASVVYGAHMTGSSPVSSGIDVVHVDITPEVAGQTTSPSTVIEQFDGNPISSGDSP